MGSWFSDGGWVIFRRRMGLNLGLVVVQIWVEFWYLMMVDWFKSGFVFSFWFGNDDSGNKSNNNLMMNLGIFWVSVLF